jgi:cell division protein FtsW
MRALDRRRAATIQQQPTVRRHTPDYWLLLITLALLAIGIIVVYSISPALAAGKESDGSTFVTRQAIAIGIGLGLFFAASKIPLRVWRQLCVPLLVLAVVATIVTLILPVDADYPAHRWIRVGGFSFQSVELLKFALIVWLAGFLVQKAAKEQLSSFEATLRPLLVLLVLVGVVVAKLQSDFGSAAVLAAITFVMVFVMGVPMRRLMVIMGLIIIGGLLFVGAIEYRRDRVSTFMNPTVDCASTEEGYQACQALIAVGSGGIAGLGLGNSVQAYGYLPEAANDSIFAIYAEKFGFIGVAVLLGLLLALYSRIKKIADGAPDDFSRLVVVGILVWLSTQAFINIGAMLGLLPLKGITLPLISYGGSSVLMVLLVLGVVFNISRYTSYSTMRNSGARREGNDDSLDRRRIRGTYHPPLSSRR